MQKWREEYFQTDNLEW